MVKDSHTPKGGGLPGLADLIFRFLNEHPTMMSSICHNGREATLRCLMSLFATLICL